MDLDGALKEMAGVLEEHRLAEARWETPDWAIVLRRATTPVEAAPQGTYAEEAPVEETVAAEKGTPVSSPMTGVYYAASSPGSPPFVKEGDAITAGAVVGLIEAMKVFNEIVAPTSGTVLRIVAQTGAVVGPGEPLLYIG